MRSPAHLAWIRGHNCSVSNGECEGRIEAAHCRTGTDGGTGLKPGDDHTLPLCSAHHHEQHQIGEPAFERKYRIKMLDISAALWRKSPHRPHG